VDEEVADYADGSYPDGFGLRMRKRDEVVDSVNWGHILTVLA
jgi:hypothetical protein